MRNYSLDRRAPADTLTRREWRAIRLINAGMKNREIAAETGNSEHVVKNLVKTVLDKLGFGTRLEVAIWYERYRDMNPENMAAMGSSPVEGK